MKAHPKSIEQMFQDYLLEVYPDVVISHQEIVILRKTFFAAFALFYSKMIHGLTKDDIIGYDREITQYQQKVEVES